MPFPAFGALWAILTGSGDVITAETMETEPMIGQQLDSGIGVDVVEFWACVSGVVAFADIAFFDDAFGKWRLFLWRRVDQLLRVGGLFACCCFCGDSGYLRRWFSSRRQSFVGEDGEPPLHLVHELFETKDDAFFSFHPRCRIGRPNERGGGPGCPV